ncbi:hypothetical protein KM800_13540 [Clostridium tyrobutyricum]|uniref:hypothetical protein n=1 Tax=Clostridium tyrobutyricum TaxID=1519 RepID=UPI001C387193|nr:hypothetical protein [Clostridium tyrobutyricum]MBV4420329.1 hypothetical protein [Clostridium tyrobutyricum]
MQYYFKNIAKYKNPVPLYFLCGVKYNFVNPKDDKRVVLKEYLEGKGYHCIILEENFVINKDKNGKMLGYKFINLENLNDVETLACMAVDGIFIIHESHSTAAEIALFASNNCIAKKTFVLIPDKENAEINHFSGFLLWGYSDLIAKREIFYPVTEKYIKNRVNVEIRTYFNKNIIGKNLSAKIDKFIDNKPDNKNLEIIESSYGKNINNLNSYRIESNKKIHISIDLEILRYYTIAIFNIPEFRKDFRSANNFFEGLTICQKWLKKLFLNTVQKHRKEDISSLDCVFEISNSINARLNFRKAISFILYILHAMEWIKIDPRNEKGISISKRTDTSRGFKYIYEKYNNIISKEDLLDRGSMYL